MIRFGMMLAVIVGGLVFDVRAQAAPPTLQIQYARLTVHARVHTVAGMKLGHDVLRQRVGETPRSRIDSPVRQSASGFALPASAFSPAVSQDQFNGVETNAAADANPFSLNHTPSASNTIYESLHRVTGYYQRADWAASGGTVIFRYQANIYDSATSALNAQLDGVTYTQQKWGVGSTDCSQSPVQCTIVNAYSSGGISLVYSTIQYHQCTLEVSVQAPDAVLSAQSTTISTTLSNMVTAGLNALGAQCSGGAPPPPTQALPPTQPPAPTATPVPPVPTPTTPSQTGTDFSIVTVRIETKNAAADWNLVKPPVERVKSGTEIQASIYWILRSAPAGSRPTFRFTINHGGKIVFDQQFSGTLAAYTADTYRFPVDFTLKDPGTYTIRGRVQLNGHSKSDTSSVTVLSKAPPRVPVVSFVFNKLQTVNAKNKPQKLFTAGQTVGIAIRYTVNHVRGTVPIRIIRTYQFNSGGGWRPLGHPIVDAFDTVNGSHFRNTSFDASASYSPLRIVVGITLGSQTKQKNATIQIRR